MIFRNGSAANFKICSGGDLSFGFLGDFTAEKRLRGGWGLCAIRSSW